MKAIRAKAREQALEEALRCHESTALAMALGNDSEAARLRALTVRYLMVRDYCRERGVE
jgi:O-methyltransferase involved in polyketide biosynthesis